MQIPPPALLPPPLILDRVEGRSKPGLSRVILGALLVLDLAFAARALLAIIVRADRL